MLWLFSKLTIEIPVAKQELEKWSKERRAVKGASGHNDKFKDAKYNDAKEELYKLTQDQHKMKQELEELLKLHELNQKAKFETG